MESSTTQTIEHHICTPNCSNVTVVDSNAVGKFKSEMSNTEGSSVCFSGATEETGGNTLSKVVDNEFESSPISETRAGEICNKSFVFTSANSKFSLLVNFRRTENTYKLNCPDALDGEIKIPNNLIHQKSQMNGKLVDLDSCIQSFVLLIMGYNVEVMTDDRVMNTFWKTLKASIKKIYV